MERELRKRGRKEKDCDSWYGYTASIGSKVEIRWKSKIHKWSKSRKLSDIVESRKFALDWIWWKVENCRKSSLASKSKMVEKGRKSHQ